MLIMSFDFGIKSIGVAIGQKITKTATSLNAIKSIKNKPNWDLIKKKLMIWKPKIAIIGLPLNMDGTEQDFSIKAKIFAKQLNKKFNIKIEMHDERLSSIEAKSNLFNIGGFKHLQKDKIDSLSAVLILESWMNKKTF